MFKGLNRPSPSASPSFGRTAKIDVYSKEPSTTLVALACIVSAGLGVATNVYSYSQGYQLGVSRTERNALAAMSSMASCSRP